MPSKKKLALRKPSTFQLVLPATSANLGPAFDAAALAFNIFLKVQARVASEFSVKARGRNQEICGRLDNHLILTTYREVLEAEGKPVQPVALHMDNQIPLGKGCGSSAAARLAAVAMAVHFGDLKWSDSRIVGEAARREHHPDNVSACWMGGLAVAKMLGEKETLIARIAPKAKWPLLLVVPEEPLPTEEARRVLPAEYSRADVVVNTQNSMLLMAALMQGRTDLLASALEDRIHQPYRAALCPLLPTLQKIVGQSGVVGTALSGAGPSVLVFVEPKANMARVKKEITAHLSAHHLSAELISTTIAERGAGQGRKT